MNQDFIKYLLQSGNTVTLNYTKEDKASTIQSWAITELSLLDDGTYQFTTYVKFSVNGVLDEHEYAKQNDIYRSYSDVCWSINWFHNSNIDKYGYIFVNLTAE